jgi:hypothetical protein
LVLKLQSTKSVSKKKIASEKKRSQDAKTSYSSYRNAVAESASILDLSRPKAMENIQGIELFVTICKTAWRIHRKPSYHCLKTRGLRLKRKVNRT